jgi:hypothetical protein
VLIYGPYFLREASVISKKSVGPTRQHQQPSIKKVTVARPCTSQRSDAGLLTHVGSDYPFFQNEYSTTPAHSISPSSFRVDKLSTFLKKRRGGLRGGMETETTMSIDEGLLTDKRCIHLGFANVRTYTFFTTGFPRFLSIRGARGLQAFDLPLLTNYSNSNYD